MKFVHPNGVYMNTTASGKVAAKFDWREDLSNSRDLSRREVEAYGYVLGWLEDWRLKKDLPPGREAARRWWKEVARTKDRPEWQLRQWEEAIRWYLNWLEACAEAGADHRSLAERVRSAVHSAIA